MQEDTLINQSLALLQKVELHKTKSRKVKLHEPGGGDHVQVGGGVRNVSPAPARRDRHEPMSTYMAVSLMSIGILLLLAALSTAVFFPSLWKWTLIISGPAIILLLLAVALYIYGNNDYSGRRPAVREGVKYSGSREQVYSGLRKGVENTRLREEAEVDIALAEILKGEKRARELLEEAKKNSTQKKRICAAMEKGEKTAEQLIGAVVMALGANLLTGAAVTMGITPQALVVAIAVVLLRMGSGYFCTET